MAGRPVNLPAALTRNAPVRRDARCQPWTLLVCAALLSCAPTLPSQPRVTPQPSRQIKKLADVDAPQSVVWDTWTTSDGVQTFLAPKAVAASEVGGPYVLIFAPENPEGRRGTEGCTVMDSVPIRKLSFEVTAPPSLGLDGARTTATVRLIPLSDEMTRVQLVHEGFLDTAAWRDAHFYFDELWSDIMQRLRTRFRNGPIDWNEVQVDFEWR